MADENGVTVTEFRRADAYGKNIEFYSNFDTDSLTFIYNEAGESTITAGEVDIKDMHSSGIIQISVTTLGSVSVQIRVEGKVDGMPGMGLIYSKTYTAAEDIDKIVNIGESIQSLRVGIKVVGPGVDVINVRGAFKTKTN